MRSRHDLNKVSSVVTARRVRLVTGCCRGWVGFADLDEVTLGAQDGCVVRRRDGQWECTMCGQLLDVPEDTEPRTAMIARSGEPNYRVVTVHGVEIHRCQISK